MNRPWAAERTVSPSLARSLIESQFPEFAPARVQLLGEGWDNTAYQVNGSFVFRFPRRQLGRECLESELRVLPSLVGRLPMPISAPTLIGQPTDAYDWPWAGYRRIPGRTACVADLDDDQRSASAASLGRFLAALHAIDPDEARRCGAPSDRLGRLDPQRRVPQAIEQLELLRARNLIDSPEPWLAIVQRTAHARPAEATSLVHGDLYARHLLVDDAARVCGVIDWGDVHVGDPAIDLAIAHSFLPPSARGEFRAAYGEISDSTWQLARFRALYHAALTAGYAHEIGDAAFLRESLRALQFVLDDDPQTT